MNQREKRARDPIAYGGCRLLRTARERIGFRDWKEKENLPFDTLTDPTRGPLSVFCTHLRAKWLFQKADWPSQGPLNHGA